MRTIKVFLPLLFLIVSVQSCVDRYYLNEYVEFEPRVVVEALLDDENPIQEIVISLSTNPEMPNREPLSACIVTVKDNFENTFYFQESADKLGSYLCNIDKNIWKVGAKLKLFIETPDGVKYTTDFEEIKPCPEVEDITYKIERKPTSDPNVTEDGLQFYIDLVADETYDRYFKWVIEETWEYHSSFVKKRYDDANGVYHNGPVDSSFFICYKTKYVNDLFSVSTEGLEQNRYDNFKLHFVNDHTQRLLYRYSILVKQYSISEKEHIFWENIIKNGKESGGLFDKQPAMVDGNIFNVADSSDKALGYFSVASMNMKRINIEEVEGLSFEYIPYCKGIPLGSPPIEDTPPTYYVYIQDDIGKYVDAIANDECVICTLLGGTTEPPSFWKE